MAANARSRVCAFIENLGFNRWIVAPARRARHSAAPPRYRYGGDIGAVPPKLADPTEEVPVRRILVALGLFSPLAGCVAAEAPQTYMTARNEATDRGLYVALRSCAGCHAVGSLGSSPSSRAPSFATIRCATANSASSDCYRP